MNNYFSFVFLSLLSLLVLETSAQFRASSYPHESRLVKEVLLGSSVRVSKISYQGSMRGRGIFSCSECNIGIDSGIVLSTGDIEFLKGPNRSNTSSGVNGTSGDENLNKLAFGRTYDAAILEFSFVADFDMVSFTYVFGSEEYDEYVGSPFHDVFGFLLIDEETGESVNMATIPGTNIPITINTLNGGKFEKYFVTNQRWKPNEVEKFNTELDGFTKPLKAYSNVIPGKVYKLKIAIADVNDQQLDSGVFIEKMSFKSQKTQEFIKENEEFLAYFEKTLEERGITTTPSRSGLFKSEQTTIDSATVEAPLPITQDELNQMDALTLYFPFDASEVTASEQKRLETFINKLDQLDQFTFTLQGHTDNFGSKSYNVILSEKRALAVKKLLNNYAVKSEKVNIQFFDFSQPAKDNNSSKNRALNRRVEIVVNQKKSD